MLVSRISPAPSRSASRAQATTSSPVGTRPPLMNTSQRSPVHLPSIATTMHWLPKRVAPAVISSGVRTAGELIETLSAPASSSAAHVVDACGCRRPR